MKKSGFFADLFSGVGNWSWDLGRIMAFLGLLPMFGGVAWNMIIGQPIDMMALGGGIAAVLTSAAALIAAKDLAHANAITKEPTE